MYNQEETFFFYLSSSTLRPSMNKPSIDREELQTFVASNDFMRFSFVNDQDGPARNILNQSLGVYESRSLDDAKNLDGIFVFFEVNSLVRS